VRSSTAIGKVADEKFNDLSDGVRSGGTSYGPTSPSSSTAYDVAARDQAHYRLKSWTLCEEDRSDPKFRDAVAVFSHSQLHCLGLSLFLARAVQTTVALSFSMIQF